MTPDDPEQRPFAEAAQALGWFDTSHRGHASGWPLFGKPGQPGQFARNWKTLCEDNDIPPSRERESS